MELRHYYDILRKRVWVILLLTAVAVTGVTFQLATRPEKYEAEVAMMVTPRILAPSSSAFEDPGLWAFQSGYRQTVLGNVGMIIRSNTVLQRVQRRVGDVTLGELYRDVRVQPVRGTDFMIITAAHRDATRAAQIANATADEFTRYFAEVNAAEAKLERTFIEGQLGQARGRLASAEQEILAFKEQTGIVAPSEHVAWTVRRLLDTQSAYEIALLDEQVARTRLSFLRTRLGSQSEMRQASVSIGTNPVFGQLRDTLTSLEVELAALRQVYTDQHPKVKTVLGRIKDTRAQMTRVAQTAVAGQTLGINPIRENIVTAMIDNEVGAAAAAARAQGTAGIVKGLEARVNALPKAEATLARLERDVRIAESLFVKLSSLHQEALIREHKASSTGQAAVLVVDPAAVPLRPQSKELPVRAGMAGLLGLVMGAGLALLMESLDTRVSTTRDAEATYGLPVLGAIPTMSARTHKQLTTAPTTSTLMLSLITALVIGGMLVGIYTMQARATPDVTQVAPAVTQPVSAPR